MFGIFQNIDSPPPSLPGECLLPRHWCRGGGHTRWAERGWGSTVRRTPDTALYSIYEYVSNLWDRMMYGVPRFLAVVSFGSMPAPPLLLQQIVSISQSSYVLPVQPAYRRWRGEDEGLGVEPNHTTTTLATVNPLCLLSMQDNI
jgi:hypothetical protein